MTFALSKDSDQEFIDFMRGVKIKMNIKEEEVLRNFKNKMDSSNESKAYKYIPDDLDDLDE